MFKQCLSIASVCEDALMCRSVIFVCWDFPDGFFEASFLYAMPVYAADALCGRRNRLWSDDEAMLLDDGGRCNRGVDLLKFPSAHS